MTAIEYRMCSKCVMDTTDGKITFNDDGICDHCIDFHMNIQPNWKTGSDGRKQLEQIVKKIKKQRAGSEYDSIIGLSGGIDSSYMLHIVVNEYGLKPLVFHVDGGWNTEFAVHNINAMIDKLNLELYTEVINWEEMKDFQLAYFKSSLPNIDIPQDHAFVAIQYRFCSENNIKYILNGGNISTECVRNPLEWIYYGTDMAQIRDILERFGTIPLKTYPFSSILWHKLYLHYVKRVKVIKPLNYVPYIKKEAVKVLEDTYGYRSYPQKHFESRFTRFYEGYWLPRKFGFDTRKVQFSSLILTGQMTREEALERLSKPALDDDEAKREFEYVATKLGITVDELQGYFEAPNKTYRDYKNSEFLFNTGAKVMKLLGREWSVKR